MGAGKTRKGQRGSWGIPESGLWTRFHRQRGHGEGFCRRETRAWGSDFQIIRPRSEPGETGGKT